MSRARVAQPKWSGRYALARTRECLIVHGRICHLCGQPGATTADHVVPRSKGGSDDIANLRPAHFGCNGARQDTDLDEWFRRHPMHSTSALLAPSREW